MGKMKANRKFVEGEEAVSAVIGVILMVAITVAIAATVYVYVSGMLGGGPTAAPTVGMIQVGNYISIQQVERGPITYTDVAITVINISGIAAAAGATYNDVDNDGYVSGGDTINMTTGWLGGTHTGHVPYTVSLIYQDDAIGTAKFTPI
jgi:flagellin-like protein